MGDASNTIITKAPTTVLYKEQRSDATLKRFISMLECNDEADKALVPSDLYIDESGFL